MQSTLAQLLTHIEDGISRDVLRQMLRANAGPLSSTVIDNPGLAIKSASSAVVKAANATYAIVDGALVSKSANTDMAALDGTVLNATFNVFVFYVDKAGTLASKMGTAGTTLGLVKFPTLPEKVARYGFVLINPTGTGNFVGGTTALDDATVVPNAVYKNTPFPCDPSLLLD